MLLHAGRQSEVLSVLRVSRCPEIFPPGTVKYAGWNVFGGVADAQLHFDRACCASLPILSVPRTPPSHTSLPPPTGSQYLPARPDGLCALSSCCLSAAAAASSASIFGSTSSWIACATVRGPAGSAAAVEADARESMEEEVEEEEGGGRREEEANSTDEKI